MALTSEEHIDITNEFDKQTEFKKFVVKTTMTPEQIREAVMEHDHAFARDDNDFSWVLVVSYHEHLNQSEEDYLDQYVSWIYQGDDDGADE